MNSVIKAYRLYKGGSFADHAHLINLTTEAKVSQYCETYARDLDKLFIQLICRIPLNPVGSSWFWKYSGNYVSGRQWLDGQRPEVPSWALIPDLETPDSRWE